MATAVKKTSKAKKSPAKAPKTKKTSTYNGKITRVIAGVGIALMVLMLTVACFSYIFTGVDDQNVQQGEHYGNVLGAVGYFISHVVMNRMGLSTFFIMAIGFAIAGIIILDKPFSRIALFISKMLLCALWVGVVVAYFSSVYSGKWGYNLHEMLYDKLGWGLALILLLFPLAWVIVHFSITPEKINQWREQRAEAKQLKNDAQMEEEVRREAENIALEKMAEADDAAQSEPLVGGEVVEQEEPVVFEVPDYSPSDESKDQETTPSSAEYDVVDHGEKEDTFQTPTGAETAPKHNTGYDVEDDIPDEEEYTEQIIDDECHATGSKSTAQNDTLPAEGEVIHENDGGVDCTMTISPTEGEISEDLARQIVEKNGEYDPKLELSQYRFPTISMLRKFDNEGINVDKEEVVENRRRIVDTLKNYGIEISHIHSTIGPTVTLYEIIPAPGVKISKIKSLEDDIALSLSALGIRIIAPIPGKGTIGIEVPNKEPSMVSMNSVIASKKFQTAQMELPVAIGKNISNETVVFDLAKMPHLLMAGATGQGKSVGLNAVLASLLYKKHPSQVKFVLVDPKKVELTLYNKIERHYLAKLPDSADAIITDTSKVIDTLNSLCGEMDKRYDLLKDAYVRNIKEYNAKFISRRLNPEKGHHFMPYIVLVVDEFADLIMTAGKEVETPIARLAQLARAVGIHLIIATQRPSVNVITGLIKANFPARIAFRVTSKIDSRTILDASGADQLIGKGDMLLSANNEMIRVQCAFIDTPEVEEICDFIGNQKGYPTAFLLPEVEHSGDEGVVSRGNDSERDSKFEEAARLVVAMQQGSASVIQRKLSIGFNRAGRIIDQLESAGVIGPFNGSKAREVLISDESTLNRLIFGTDVNTVHND